LTVLERSNSVPFTETETETETETGTTVTAVTARAASRSSKRPTARGSWDILVEVTKAVKKRGLPAINEGLKDILAGQIGILLRGGWPKTEVERAALDLALAWDEKRGHSRLAHLASRVRAMDADRRIAEHNQLLAAEKAALAGQDPVEVNRKDPSLHPFSQDPRQEPNTCRQCAGPVGVHVARRVSIA